MRAAFQPIRLVPFFLLLFGIARPALQPVLAIDKQRLRQAPRGPELQGQPRARQRIAPAIVPPDRPPTGRWTLGIRADNLDSGVRITQVVPGTAAARVGLERRDVIVSVNGFQVGRVLRQIYAFDDELQLRADRLGWVRLLVWNHRDGELVNMDVQLDKQGRPDPRPRPRPGGIRGTVTFRTSVPANKQSTLFVRLIDITGPLGANQPLAEDKILFDGQVPVAFKLDVNAAQLNPNRRYALQAFLEVNGRRILANRPSDNLLRDIGPGGARITLQPVRFDKQRPR